MAVYALRPAHVDGHTPLVPVQRDGWHNRLIELLRDVRSRRGSWEPFEVEELRPGLPTADFPYMYPGVILLGSRAAAVLGPHLEGFAELLPLGFGGTPLALMNVTNGHREFLTASTPLGYSFSEEAVAGEFVFTLSSGLATFYCTDALKSLVEGAGLTGLEFVRINTETFSNERPPTPPPDFAPVGLRLSAEESRRVAAAAVELTAPQLDIVDDNCYQARQLLARLGEAAADEATDPTTTLKALERLASSYIRKDLEDLEPTHVGAVAGNLLGEQLRLLLGWGWYDIGGDRSRWVVARPDFTSYLTVEEWMTAVVLGQADYRLVHELVDSEAKR